MQPQLASQHEPVHGEGVQVVPRPLKVVPPAHPVTSTLVQAQVMLSQHTPGQAAAQVPLQVNALGARQALGALIVQTPVTESQHLPMQGVGEHVPPQ